MVGLIVHEWVAKAGGSENVVGEFVKEFPESDLQVLWDDSLGRFDVPTYETWLARTPLRKNKALALPFLPVTWRTVPARQKYEWMLVSSHLFAHHISPRGAGSGVPKLVYAHTPARYIWSPELDPRGAGKAARIVSAALKPLDRRRAAEATAIAANSEFTRRRIQDAWHRDATVIYPPVDTDRIIAARSDCGLTDQEQELLSGLPNSFLLGASRFVSYKRLDWVIAAGEATGLPVVLAGRGPDEAALKIRAESSSAHVTFIDRPSTSLLIALYTAAAAFVFPAIEDFGIMPVEAMAAGTPVIVSATGGAAESVSLLCGGTTITENTPDQWREAMRRVLEVDRESLPMRATVFSNARFRREIRRWLDEHSVETSV